MTSLYSEIAYVYDGTLEGLLTAIFCAYERHEKPSDVVSNTHVQFRLDQNIVEIETNPSHALRVRKRLVSLCGDKSFDAIAYASLSDDPQAGTIAYRFVRYALDKHPAAVCLACTRHQACPAYRERRMCPEPFKRPFSNLSHPDVKSLHDLWKQVGSERERMLQFIRFEHLEQGAWYAKCNPNASVVPLVMDHFAKRFNTQAFMIYDENHRIAGIYEGRHSAQGRPAWYLVDAAEFGFQEPSPDARAAEERIMQDAWKKFYRALSIESRYNPELRLQNMPLRLWKNITEMQP